MATAFQFNISAFDFDLPLFASFRPHAILLASSAVVAYVSLLVFRYRNRNGAAIKRPSFFAPFQQAALSPKLVQEEDVTQHYPELDPLDDFRYSTASPLHIRPYKPKYHLTMGIQNNPANDLIVMDKNYVTRLALRRRILQTHINTVIGYLPEAASAVQEFYTYIFSHHLPARFPTMFSLSPSGTLCNNLLTQQCAPVAPPSTVMALKTLAENVEDDFIFLLPDPREEGTWRAVAFDVLFPSGFDMSEKLGSPMKQLHKPIPGIEAKLGLSINRFFGKLKPGVENGVKRVNWGIARSGELFALSGTHVYDDEMADMGSQEDVDITKCHLRCERQTFWKLPQSEAVVFGIRTYLTPLTELKKEEGEAERLAEAIEGMGSEIGRYKGRGVWGNKVLEFLRS